jgi:hypothetical protein
MNTYRKNAIWVGILFILCSAASIIGMTMGNSLLNAPDYLTSLAANENKVIIAALFEVIWAASGVGIAIALYPAIRRFNRSLALGSVAFRVIEGVMAVIGTLAMLSLLTLSKEFFLSGSPADVSSGPLFIGMRDWAQSVLAIIFFLVGALMYYLVMYKSRLIPRWLSGWGIIGAVMGLAAVLVGAFNPSFLNGAGNTILNVPIGVQEMVLAVWLIAKGFNQKAIAALSGKAVTN